MKYKWNIMVFELSNVYVGFRCKSLVSVVVVVYVIEGMGIEVCL